MPEVTRTSRCFSRRIRPQLASGQEGYYITNGKAIPITWTKTSDTERTVYRDLNGDEITINTGKTYIGFVADDVWSELVVE